MTMQTTTSAKVYGLIITTPGLTVRQIRASLPNESGAAVNSACFNLTKRGAVLAVSEEGKRSTKFYKGAAPVTLRQASGVLQKDVGKTDLMVAELRQEVKAGIAVLQGLLKKMETV